MDPISRLASKKPFNYSQSEILEARNRCITALSVLYSFCPSSLGLYRSSLLRYRESVRAIGLDIIDYYEDKD